MKLLLEPTSEVNVTVDVLVYTTTFTNILLYNFTNVRSSIRVGQFLHPWQNIAR
jgi:hypothetical protein